MRQGLGKGQGTGYYNLVPRDPYIHSLSAKGIKTQVKNTSFGYLPSHQKKGLIKEIARKAKDGAKWAIEWEKEHLPAQKEWVKKEYGKAKEEAIKLEKVAESRIKSWKEQMRENKIKSELEKGGIEPYYDDLKKKKDLEDVRDELDVNDDGVQDIDIGELEDANQEIVGDLDTIDTDYNGVPDHREENFTDLSTLDPIPEYDVENGEKSIGIPFPFMTGDDMPEPPKPQPRTFFQKTGDFAKKEIEVGRQYIAKKQAESRELRQMSDMELKTISIREGANLFGGKNKYEKEILRREEMRIKLDKEIQDIRQGKKPKGGGGSELFGFLNPISVFSNSSSQPKSSQIRYPSFVNPLSAFQVRPSYDSRLRPVTNKGFSPFGFVNPVETLKGGVR